jgi:hypothetical protein
MPYWLDKVVQILQADTDDLRELAKLAGANPQTFYRGINPADLDLNGQDITGMEFSGDLAGRSKTLDHFKLVLDSNDRHGEAIKIIQEVHHVGKQEERMAILLDLILRNPNDAPLLIELYDKDRAKYANLVLKQIEVEIKTSALGGTLFEGEQRRPRMNAMQLARILNRPFSRGMPMNRAWLLYYMAKYLSKYPDINKYLRMRLTTTQSIFVNPYRREILQFLDEGIESKDV